LDFQAKNYLRKLRGAAQSNAMDSLVKISLRNPAQWNFKLNFVCAASATVAAAKFCLRSPRRGCASQNPPAPSPQRIFWLRSRFAGSAAAKTRD